MRGIGFSRRRAFSILESLVVMFIILLLTSIVIPGLMGRGKEQPELPELKLPVETKENEKAAPIRDPESVSTRR